MLVWGKSAPKMYNYPKGFTTIIKGTLRPSIKIRVNHDCPIYAVKYITNI